MDFETDADIFNRIKQDDQKALELLHERYYQPLCNFALTFLKDVDDTEEVVSDVFLAIWLKRDSLSIKSSIKSYLFTAVKNQSINFLNAQKNRFEEIDLLTKSEGCSNDHADKHLIYSETLTWIELIIEQLPPQRRTIFRLNRMEGMKYKEIADLMSISIHTVQKQMTEAVKHIAQYSSTTSFVLFSFFK